MQSSMAFQTPERLPHPQTSPAVKTGIGKGQSVMVQDVKDRSECNNWNKFIQEARNEKERKKERKKDC